MRGDLRATPADRQASLARWRDLLRIRLSGRWRPVAVLVFVLAGLLFATTSINSKGLDLRAASVTDLAGVVREEREHAQDLQARVADLNDEVTALGRQVSDVQVSDLQRQVDQLRRPAGFTAVTGPGLTVVLSDAPKEQIDAARADPGGVTEEELIVHQQDIQAVVNALWAGGAEAMTLQGQRVISTTGIKCVGNTVVLHGVPYSPPYRIAAIGDPGTLRAALDASEYVYDYRTFVINYGLGYDVVESPRLELPPYGGATTLKYAVAAPADRPARD